MLPLPPSYDYLFQVDVSEILGITQEELINLVERGLPFLAEYEGEFVFHENMLEDVQAVAACLAAGCHQPVGAGGACLSCEVHNTPLISCRQAQRGDWIVCEALPATFGVGVERVGGPAAGYKTGSIYERGYSSKDEAWEDAVRLAVARGATVVEWRHPQPNPQFKDLPRQYPTQTGGYESWEAVSADGWVTISPSKTIGHYRGRTIHCVDITPGRSFGYELAIECAGIRYLESTTVWVVDGAVSEFSPAFRSGDLVDAIEAAHRWIDEDLITQARAAQLAGITTQAVNNATRDGRLEIYANDEATNPRHGGKLVSRQQVQQVWGKA